jgi:hypothetical protein
MKLKVKKGTSLTDEFEDYEVKLKINWKKVAIVTGLTVVALAALVVIIAKVTAKDEEADRMAAMDLIDKLNLQDRTVRDYLYSALWEGIRLDREDAEQLFDFEADEFDIERTRDTTETIKQELEEMRR